MCVEGIIVNNYLPNWLLALLWVLFMAISNIELIYSWVRIRRLKRDGSRVLKQLQALDAEAAAQPAVGHKTPVVDPAIHMTTTSNGDATVVAGSKDAANTPNTGVNASAKDVAVPTAGTAAVRQQLVEELQAIGNRAEHTESIALLYPAFHMPTMQRVMSQQSQPGTSGLLDPDTKREATPSTLALIAEDKQQLQEMLEQQRWAGTRFTLRWKVGEVLLVTAASVGWLM